MADRTVVYRLRADLNSFRAQMAQGAASTKKLADDLTGLDKAGARTRRGLDTLGGAAGKIGLVAAAGLGTAVLQAANFDQAMSNVQAATQESAQNMDALRQAALDAGAQTVFSATESAAAIENLAKAGISTTDILGGGLQGALDLAAAGSLEVADAAEIAATALTQFGLGGEDVPHVADLLAAGAGKAQGEVTDLAFALKQSGLVAAQMGLSIEETTGTLSAFASAGLLGSDAGTSFRTMLLRLANPTKESKELLDELGISAYDMQGNFVGIESLAGQLSTAFEGQTQATRDAALATIFGSDSIRAANVLYEQGSAGVAEWTDKVNDSGFAAETAATKLNNLKGDLEELGGALQTALIGTGSGAQGPLRAITQQLTDVVNAYNKLPPAAQTGVSALLTTGALLGGSIWVGTKLIRGISDTREALGNLGVTGGKTGRALSVIGRTAGVVAGIFALDTALDALNSTLEDTAPRGEELTTRLLDLSDGRVSDLGKDFADLGENLDRIGTGKLFDVFEGADSLPAIGSGLALINNALPGESSQEAFREFRDQIDAVDASLTGLVSSGGPEQAQAAFDSLADSMNLTESGRQELLAGLPQFTDALAGAANETRLTADAATSAATATDDYAVAQENVSKVAQATTERIKAQREAIKAQREAATTSAESFVNLGDKLDKGKVSLGGWIKQLENQAEALANFRENAKEAGEKGLDKGLIRSLEEAGEAGALRMKQLANATDEEIDRVNKAWRSGQDEIGKYVKATAKVPKKTSTTVTVASSDAMAKLREFQEMLDNATKPRTARLALTLLLDAQGYQTRGGLQRAQGGTVSGPGSATSDSIPAWLSNGEFVMRAAAVQKYGTAFFHQLNAMKLAGGGMVSRQSAPVVNVAGGQINVRELAQALAELRPPQPLYGDVNVTDGYGGFKKQLEQDRQAAANGRL